ncbi:hypothetical protein [Salinigranum sp. GCM10025319]|uniref:hypothetical protein n=1 Tax=Salinigranum sp. GCM10025319 TaxID=3252687 RepID=UPI003610E75E
MSSRPTLAALLRGRSRTTLVRFVADLYDARGAETVVEDGAVVVDGERFLVVARGPIPAGFRTPRHAPATVDRIVAVDAPRAERLAARYDARPVSAADLDDLARYGLDREAADAVFRDRFGRPVSAVGPRPRLVASDEDDDSSASRVVGGVAVLAALALLGLALSGPGAAASAFPWAWDAADSISVSRPVTPSPPSDAGTDAPADPATLTVSDGNASGGVDPDPSVPFPPGLSAAGDVDTDALAAAHAAALGNGSYRWDLAYVESVNGSVVARGTETVRVESRRQYVSAVDWTGSPVGVSPVAARPSYADGAARYRPAADGPGFVTRSLTDVPPAGEQGWRASRYLRWFLSGSLTTVSVENATVDHDERPVAVVTLNGTASVESERYAARAHVTADGFVRRLSVSYVLAEPDHPAPVDVRFTFRYHPVDNVSAPPPPWFTGESRSAG